MTTRRRDSEAFEEDLGGFLQDPALWVDRLPQPFRTIDDVLQELVSSAWEAIEARKTQKERDQARVHVPKAADVQLLSGVEGVNAINSGRGRLVFVGSSSGLTVLDARGGAEEERVELLAQCEGVDVRRVEVACSKDVHFVAVLLQNGTPFSLRPSHLWLYIEAIMSFFCGISQPSWCSIIHWQHMHAVLVQTCPLSLLADRAMAYCPIHHKLVKLFLCSPRSP